MKGVELYGQVRRAVYVEGLSRREAASSRRETFEPARGNHVPIPVAATDTDKYSIAPRRTEPFRSLPQPNTTFAFGRPPGVPDSRFPEALPNGPFPISRYTAYQLSFTGDPVHRFFQMWQQFDEGRNDLFTWAGVTIGTGSDGRLPPSPFTDQSTRQGGVGMGFYNMSAGDAPVFRFVADNYAIADNFHQGIMGGTGASFIYLGTGDMAFYR